MSTCQLELIIEQLE